MILSLKQAVLFQSLTITLSSLTLLYNLQTSKVVLYCVSIAMYCSTYSTSNALFALETKSSTGRSPPITSKGKPFSPIKYVTGIHTMGSLNAVKDFYITKVSIL